MLHVCLIIFNAYHWDLTTCAVYGDTQDVTDGDTQDVTDT